MRARESGGSKRRQQATQAEGMADHSAVRGGKRQRIEEAGEAAATAGAMSKAHSSSAAASSASSSRPPWIACPKPRFKWPCFA